MSLDLDLAGSLWLAAQSGRSARAVEAELKRLARENYELRTRVHHMADGFPDGVTKEEWEIIKELRRCAP